MPTNKKRLERRMKVGDRIVIRLGARRVLATIVEDRGAIGVGGRRLLRVRRAGKAAENTPAYEVPAEEVELASRPSRSMPPTTTPAKRAGGTSHSRRASYTKAVSRPR